MVLSFCMFGPVLAVLLQQRGYGTAAVGAFAMIAFACVATIMPLYAALDKSLWAKGVLHRRHVHGNRRHAGLLHH